MPLDILLPYWGDPDHMRQALDSVLAQEDPDWLLTIVDDAYPQDWLGAHVAAIDDNRITFVRNETNRGITENYRRCLELATQDVVVFFGCDDVMLPGFVGAIRGAARAFPHATVIQPGVRVIDEHGTIQRPLADIVKQRFMMPRVRGRRLLAGEELAVSLLRADWMYWPSLAFRREALLATPFRDDFPITQDLALVMDMVLQGGSLLLDDADVFRYRRHQGSASSTSLLSGKRFAGERRYFALARRETQRVGWRRAARAASIHLTSRLYALTLIPTAIAQREPAAVGRLLSHALRP